MRIGLALSLCTLLVSLNAHAYPGGKTGYSGNPSTSSNTCASCHTGTLLTTYNPSFSGGSTVAPSSSLSLAFNLSSIFATGADSSGVDISTTAGTLSAGTGTRVSSTSISHNDPVLGSFTDSRDGELVHDFPTDMSLTSGNASWSFTFNAPSTVGTVTLYGCGLATFWNGDTSDDGPVQCTSKTITVNSTPNAANDTPSVNKNSSNNSLSVLTNDTSGSSANDSGDLISIISVSAPNQGGNASISMGTQITYTPASGFVGSETFTYTVIDVLGATSSATVSVTVSNRAPTASTNSYSTNEDTSLTVLVGSGVLVNDSDPDGDGITAVKDTNPSHGSVTLNSDGSFTYIPTANYAGADSFTYHATDGSANSTTTTVSLTVNPINDAPTANADTYSINQDTTLNVAASGVLSNDTDPDPDTLSAIKDSNPSHGSVTLNSNGSFSYIPTGGYNGSDSFTYHVNDGTTNSGSVTVSITVTAVNHAPVANADSYSTSEDTTLSVNAASGVLGNDTDSDANTLTVVKDSDPAHGTLTLNANGSFSYVPATNFNGSDSFSYHANDGSTNSSTVTVSLTINAVNDVPVATLDNYSVSEDATLTVAAGSGVLINDSDAESSPLTAVKDTNPSHGSLTLNANGSFTYIPNADFSGTDSFTYHANDGSGNSTSATVTLTVIGINDAPVALADTYAVDQDTTLTVAANGVLTNDTDADGNALTAIKDTNPTHGTLAFNSNGSFTYTPTTSYLGGDSFTYHVSDGTLSSATVTVSLTVNAANHAPVANADTYSATADTTLNIAAVSGLLANDSDADSNPLTAVKDSDPSHGTLNLNTDGSFTYLPTTHYSGADSFTYHANDGVGNSATVTVSLTVAAGNTAPVANADTYSVNEDTALDVPAQGVLVNDTDSDSGDTLTAVKDTNPSHGSLTLNSNGSLHYVPATNYKGTDSFTYHAYDGTTSSNSVTVTLTINAHNQAPVAVADSFSAHRNKTLVIASPQGLLANDTDQDNDTLSAIKTSEPSHGALALNSDGSLRYTPLLNFVGNDSFTYYTSDGTANSSPVTVAIAVLETPPVINMPANIVKTATGYLTAVDLGTATATDANGKTLNVTTDAPAVFRPGHHLVTYTATDANQVSATATQTVDIIPLASLGADQTSNPGKTLNASFMLNGPAVTYPVTLEYTLGGTAEAGDSDAHSGQVTLASGTQVNLPITLTEDTSERADRTITLTLTSATNAVAMENARMTITITGRALPPRIQLVAMQQAEERTRLFNGQGAATFKVQPIASRAGDTLTYDWRGTDAALGAPAQGEDNFTICPVAACDGGAKVVPPGTYTVVVKATNALNQSTEIRSSILVANTAPVLTTADSDEDGINDITEGLADSLGTGIPHYLDPYDTGFVIPANKGAKKYIRAVETKPGFTLKLGKLAMANAQTNAMLDAAPPDNLFNNPAGVFSVEVNNLGETDETASFILPLNNALPASSRYREYMACCGWVDFTVTQADAVFGALAVNGVCPSLNSNAWVSGLHAGDTCLRVTLSDGGPNDDDKLKNGSVAHVGGAAAAQPTPPITIPVVATKPEKGGGFTSPLLILLVLGLAFRRKSKR